MVVQMASVMVTMMVAYLAMKKAELLDEQTAAYSVAYLVIRMAA